MFWSENYKFCDMTGCTYDMTFYIGKDSKKVTNKMRPTHTNITHLTRRGEIVGGGGL